MAVSPALATPPTTNSAATTTASAANTTTPLGQADFLKLLMAQMQNQDPLNPVSPTDMTSQLSQLSSVQGIQQLNTNITQMLALQQMTQAANLIGKQVTFDVPGKMLPGQGTVSAVGVANGQVNLTVGTQQLTLSQVKTIQAGS
jgi:flagellar basal-body rod modification protein FlgD